MIQVHTSHQELSRIGNKTNRVFIAQVFEDDRPIHHSDRSAFIASQFYFDGGADEAERRAFADLRRAWHSIRPGQPMPSCLLRAAT